jgi:hypothetical protein
MFCFQPGIDICYICLQLLYRSNKPVFVVTDNKNAQQHNGFACVWFNFLLTLKRAYTEFRIYLLYKKVTSWNKSYLFKNLSLHKTYKEYAFYFREQSFTKSNRLSCVLETHKEHISIVLEGICYLQPITFIRNYIIRRTSCVDHSNSSLRNFDLTRCKTRIWEQMDAMNPVAIQCCCTERRNKLDTVWSVTEFVAYSCTLHLTREDQMDRVCGTRGKDENCLHSLVRKPKGKRRLDLDIDRRIILRRILKKYDMRMRTRFIWLKTGTSGELLCTRKWTFGLYKRGNSSWRSSEEGLCPIEVASHATLMPTLILRAVW